MLGNLRPDGHLCAETGHTVALFHAVRSGHRHILAGIGDEGLRRHLFGHLLYLRRIGNADDIDVPHAQSDVEQLLIQLLGHLLAQGTVVGLQPDENIQPHGALAVQDGLCHDPAHLAPDPLRNVIDGIAVPHAGHLADERQIVSEIDDHIAVHPYGDAAGHLGGGDHNALGGAPVQGQVLAVDEIDLGTLAGIAAQVQRRADIGEERNDLGIDIIVALIFKDAVNAAAGIEDGLLPGPDDQVASLFDLPVLPFVKE